VKRTVDNYRAPAILLCSILALNAEDL